MPLELRIFFGARYFGDNSQKRKNALILEREKYTYQQYISDLNGIDTKAHNNDAVTALKRVHSWLNSASRRKNMPGEKALVTSFEKFEQKLPDLAMEMGYSLANLPFLNLLDLIEEWAAQQLAAEVS